jgi:hypothetical protein
MSWKEVADELERAERIVAQMEAEGHDETLEDDVFGQEEGGEQGQQQREQPPEQVRSNSM